MIPLAVLMRELERRQRNQWTGKLVLDFKDGNVSIDQEKLARGDKRRA